MPLETIRCPNCGASFLRPEKLTQAINCTYCGNLLVLSDKGAPAGLAVGIASVKEDTHAIRQDTGLLAAAQALEVLDRQHARLIEERTALAEKAMPRIDAQSVVALMVCLAFFGFLAWRYGLVSLGTLMVWVPALTVGGVVAYAAVARAAGRRAQARLTELNIEIGALTHRRRELERKVEKGIEQM